MRIVPLFCLSLIAAAVVPFGEAMASAGPLGDPGDPGQLYTFDDVRVNCGWNVSTSGLYADLVFPTSSYLSPCNTPNGTVGLVPSREGVTGRLEIRVQLPSPASAVSLDSYLYAVREDPTLIAYGADGVELGRAGDGTLGSWVTLEVQASSDTPITEIGLLMPQLSGYIDNLMVTYVGDGTVPEVETVPEVPVTRSDCTNGEWAVFGFRNQGQCVRFVRTRKDSR